MMRKRGTSLGGVVGVGIVRCCCIRPLSSVTVSLRNVVATWSFEKEAIDLGVE
jgi:hypothetical protein